MTAPGSRGNRRPFEAGFRKGGEFGPTGGEYVERYEGDLPRGVGSVLIDVGFVIRSVAVVEFIGGRGLEEVLGSGSIRDEPEGGRKGV